MSDNIIPEIKIEKGIPVPPPYSRLVASKWGPYAEAMEEMAFGDSFLMSLRGKTESGTFKNYLVGRGFAVMLQRVEKDIYRVWKTIPSPGSRAEAKWEERKEEQRRAIDFSNRLVKAEKERLELEGLEGDE
jgi:hypothetical protein